MIYIFDFDGVLFNTVDELGVLTYCSLKNIQMNPTSVPKGYLEYFKINRPRPVNGLGMMICAKLCLEEFEDEKAPHLISKEIFLNRYNKENESSKNLEDTFFKNRYSFMTNNQDDWLSLNNPYPKIWHFLKDKNFYIVSNKDKSSIKLLLTHFGKKLDDNFIFSSDEDGSKSEKILKIYKKENQECTFIDDALDNLIKIDNKLNPSSWLSLCLAGWGYINPEDKELLKIYSKIKFLKDEEDFLNNVYQK